MTDTKFTRTERNAALALQSRDKCAKRIAFILTELGSLVTDRGGDAPTWGHVDDLWHVAERLDEVLGFARSGRRS